ncbi:MotA/TolQ/ExbB proton channel family protein [Roseibacillus ishigakijimensis]|uniref:MotA/TolQ/ExbB proton channel family protein n=1 Tax=Roseibacillus ishigakijimensis TaxID=454146 RepID=A0A934VMJ3_9BACT|nr:MotA/TolQ/ExbB proton channel family protein [Roseibacillus ishigakijimensis]MBK1834151.1 MotA/TolQ/ExbB proton channel family protein [Roseibacillus ishigakijimensis]
MTSILQKLPLELQSVLDQGGPILWLLLLLCIVLYSILTSTWLGLFEVKKAIKGLDLTLAHERCEEEVRCDVALFELDKLAWVRRRIPVLSVLCALAPLAGLLGTVSGMLSTFSGMASQHAAKPIDAISSGISEALLTTQAGLLIAIPATLIFALLKSQLAHVHHTLEQHACQTVVQLKTPQP